jgi:hypothetical protein
MMTGIQLISILFCFLMLYVTFLHVKKRQLHTIEGLLFGLVWVVAIIITILPKTVSYVLETFRIYRLLDLATIGGFMLLIGLSFSNYLTIKELKKKVETLTRELALSKHSKEKRS